MAGRAPSWPRGPVIGSRRYLLLLRLSLLPQLLYHVDLNPIAGREQAGPRYVLVVSPKVFNNLGTPLVCPITQGGDFARRAGYAVSLSGAGTNTQGVILCNQPRVLDLQARGGRFVERAPDFVMDEVLAKLATLIE